LGRYGFQRFGVPVSGVMDKYAFLCANSLVDNQTNDTCLEVTLFGPEFEVLHEAEVAVTGANFALTLNGDSVPMWETMNVKEGDRIAFVESAQSGCRAYLAVRGGFDVPILLGSRSTYTRGGFGGFEGRALRVGDVLRAFEPKSSLKAKRTLPSALVPSYESEFVVNVVLGPQEDMFTERGAETFLSNYYTVTPESDRMGFRLDGALIAHKDVTEIVTDALVQGAVQVPADGKPIVLMADAQTSGGYPKIATVTTLGISRLAQAKPNDKVHFNKVSLVEAHKQFIEFQRTLNQLTKPDF